MMMMMMMMMMITTPNFMHFQGKFDPSQIWVMTPVVLGDILLGRDFLPLKKSKGLAAKNDGFQVRNLLSLKGPFSS